jgi:hypothetical protein
MSEPCSWCKCEQHKPLCPLYPEFGYNENGVPRTESQRYQYFYELGRKFAQRRNEIAMKILRGEK